MSAECGVRSAECGMGFCHEFTRMHTNKSSMTAKPNDRRRRNDARRAYDARSANDRKLICENLSNLWNLCAISA